MRNLRWPALFFSLLVSGIPAAFAETTVVHKIGVSPLLGTSSTTAEIRQKIHDNPGLMHDAAAKIGMTPAEYHQFYEKFMNEKPGWGTIPRHLDAMSWASDGEAHAIYDVQIPAGTNGWQVDLVEKKQIVHVYIPMVCGNISIVRQPRRQVAVRPPLPPRHVFPAPPAPVVAVPAPVPLVAAESPAQDIPPVATPVVHHPHLLLPILAGVAIAAIALSNHNGGGSTPLVPVGGRTVVTPPGIPGTGTVTVPAPPIVVVPTPVPGGHICGCH